MEIGLVLPSSPDSVIVGLAGGRILHLQGRLVSIREGVYLEVRWETSRKGHLRRNHEDGCSS